MSDARSKDQASLIFYLNTFSFDIMEVYIIQELNYLRCGDYYIPDIRLEKPNIRLGKWGRMRREYLRLAHPVLFSELVLSEKLYAHCAKIESTAKSRMEIIVPQLMKHYGVVEKLKASNQLEWVRQMNSCVAQAEEAIRLYYHRILILDWFCAIIRLKLVWRDWNVERTYILRHLYFAKRYAN